MEAAAAAGGGYTVEEALGAVGFGRFQAMALVYSGLGYAAEAMEVMLLSFIGPPLQAKWGISAAQESLLTSVVFAGMLVGAYTWGVVSDGCGRRKGFLFTALVTGGAGFLGAFAPNYITLIIIRFVVGVGLGGGPVLLSWFLEFVPTPNRGKWMIVFSCFWTFGTVLEASLAWAIMPSLGWRWLLALSALPSFLLLLFYGFTPEAPRYLSMKGRTEDAMRVLERVARVSQKRLPHGTLVSERTAELHGKPNPTSVTECNAELDNKPNPQEHPMTIENNVTLDEGAPTMGGIKVLRRILSPKLIKSTFLLWMDFFGNAFAYYGVILLTSALVHEKRCSRTSSKSLPVANPYKDVFITSFAEFPGFLLSAAMVDRIGRKLSMLSMLCIGGVLLIPLMFHQTEAITTALLFGARICVSGSFNLLYIYAPEVYPTSVRSTGLGIASSVGRIGGILCPLVAVGLVRSCRKTEAIVLFEVVIGLSSVAVYFFPFETKGHGLRDSVHSL